MKKNRLPKYWAVNNDGSQLFKDTVIKYLNEIEDDDQITWLRGNIINAYYGYNYKQDSIGVFTSKRLSTNTIVLSLTEFIDLTNTCQPKRGDKVLVSDSSDKVKLEKIYLTTIEGAIYPYITVLQDSEQDFLEGRPFSTSKWKYIHPIEEIKPIKLTVSQIEKRLGHGVEIISDEQ